MSGRSAPRALLGAAAVALLVAAIVHLGCGAEGMGFLRSLGILVGVGDADVLDIARVRLIRLPRLLTATFAGASLAVAGAVMQAAFRNPLASPDVVGTAAGAAFGGALAILLGLAASSVAATPVLSMVGASLVTWLVFRLAGTGAAFSTTGLLLAGIALNTLVGALTAFAVTLKYTNYSASPEVLFWLMGGLDRSSWVSAAITAAGFLLFAALLACRVRDLDLLTLRDDSAHSLGIDAPAARRWVLWSACGLTAATVANTGGIAFVGLVVPHLARLWIGPAHRLLLPAAALLGAALLVLADFACRSTPPEWSLRLGVVTSLLGAPYFLFLLARHRRGEALR